MFSTRWRIVWGRRLTSLRMSLGGWCYDGSDGHGDSKAKGPVLIRSTTLKVMKKALSWYMPNPLSYLEPIKRYQTESTNMNILIKFIKKREVQQLGKTCNTKWPVTMAEFYKALKMLESPIDFEHKFWYTTMLKYQHHSIACCDVVGNFCLRNLFLHSDPRCPSFSSQAKVILIIVYCWL